MENKVKSYSVLEDEDKIIQCILDELNTYDELVVINIGTDKCIGDSFGPLLGTFLLESNLKNIKSYGTLQDPIHALNLQKIIPKIIKNHPNAYIIGTDACISNTLDIEKEFVKFSHSLPIKPGAGVGKSLPAVGNSSIKHILKIDERFEFFTSISRRLNDTYVSARQACSLFVNIDKKIDELLNSEKKVV